MSTFLCSQCSHKFSAPESYAGKPIKCPRCQATAAVQTRVISKQQRRLITFGFPIAMQSLLAIGHFCGAFHALTTSPGIARALWIATFAYTIILIIAGILSAASSTLEALNRKARKEEDPDLQSFRKYFKIIRVWIPAYNTSFSAKQRKLAGGIVSAIYLLALLMDGFIATALTTLVCLLLIILGMSIVRDSLQIQLEKEKKAAEKRKRREAARQGQV